MQSISASIEADFQQVLPAAYAFEAASELFGGSRTALIERPLSATQDLENKCIVCLVGDRCTGKSTILQKLLGKVVKNVDVPTNINFFRTNVLKNKSI